MLACGLPISSAASPNHIPGDHKVIPPDYSIIGNSLDRSSETTINRTANSRARDRSSVHSQGISASCNRTAKLPSGEFPGLCSLTHITTGDRADQRKSESTKPPTSGPFLAAIWRRTGLSEYARKTGGGRSHSRTRLDSNSLLTGKRTVNFVKFVGFVRF